MEEINLSGLRKRCNEQPPQWDGREHCNDPRRSPVVLFEKMPEDIEGLVKELKSAVEEYERLVSETKTNIEKAEEARYAAEKVRAKAEELRIAAEAERAASETARQSAYELIASTLTAAENDRAAAETLRQAAEALRQSTFETNEAARAAAHTAQMQSQATAYTNAEANRNGAYEEAEGDRDDAFNAKEATRDAANQAALDCAETLAALGPKIDGLDVEITGIDDITYTKDSSCYEAKYYSGTTIGSTIVEYNGTNLNWSLKIPVRNGDIVTWNTRGGNDYRHYYVVNANNVILDVYDSSTLSTVAQTTHITSENAAFFILNVLMQNATTPDGVKATVKGKNGLKKIVSKSQKEIGFIDVELLNGAYSVVSGTFYDYYASEFKATSKIVFNGALACTKNIISNVLAWNGDTYLGQGTDINWNQATHYAYNFLISSNPDGFDNFTLIDNGSLVANEIESSYVTLGPDSINVRLANGYKENITSFNIPVATETSVGLISGQDKQAINAAANIVASTDDVSYTSSTAYFVPDFYAKGMTIGDVLTFISYPNKDSGYYKIPCNNGDIFKINTKGGDGSLGFAAFYLVDSDMHILDVYYKSTVYVVSNREYIVDNPNAAYLIVNAISSGGYNVLTDSSVLLYGKESLFSQLQEKVEGNTPLSSKVIFLLGDSVSSNDYPWYKEYLEKYSGAIVYNEGASGWSARHIASNNYFSRLAGVNADIVVALIGGNDNCESGTVGTFDANSVNGLAGEPVVSESDISTDFYTGSSTEPDFNTGTHQSDYFIVAISHIFRKWKSLYYNFRLNAGLSAKIVASTDTETALYEGTESECIAYAEAQGWVLSRTGSYYLICTEDEDTKRSKLMDVKMPKFYLCTYLKGQKWSNAHPYNNAANQERKRQAILECAEKYDIPCIDTYKEWAIAVTDEPVAPGMGKSTVDKTDNQGVYTMDGLHPNEWGYEWLARIIARHIK